MNKDYILKLSNLLLPNETQEQEIQSGALKLAKAGWSMSPILWPKLFVEFNRENASDDEINEWMLAFYTQEQDKALYELIDDNLLRCSVLSDWGETIRQSRKAYELELFNILVPGLLTVLEGSLSRLVGTFSSPQVRMITPTKTKASESHKFGIDKATWLTISAVIDSLYQKSDFAASAPTDINRHWLLHGRDTSGQTKVNVIKLFNLLGSLSLAAA